MKKTFKTLLFCLLFGKSCLGRKPDYTIYHDSINQAEHLFLENKNEESIALYKRIFEKYQFVFAKDCLIAGQIALLFKDSSNAAFFTARAFQQGVEIDYLLQLTVYKAFMEQEIWHNVVDSYVENRRIYFKYMDFERKKKWAARYNLEQELKHVKTMPAYKTKMLENVNTVIQECKTIGFPGEKALGIDESTLTPTRSDIGISCDVAYISLLHHGCSYDLLKKYFDTEIRKGNIHPRYCAYLADFLKIIRQNADMGCDTTTYPSAYIDFLNKMSDAEILKVNELRAKLHICSVEQDRAKAQYEVKNGVKLSFGFGMNKGAL